MKDNIIETFRRFVWWLIPKSDVQLYVRCLGFGLLTMVPLFLHFHFVINLVYMVAMALAVAYFFGSMYKEYQNHTDAEEEVKEEEKPTTFPPPTSRVFVDSQLLIPGFPVPPPPKPTLRPDVDGFEFGFEGSVFLTIKEIWPDGDWPDNPTVDDVVKIVDNIPKSRLLDDWEMIDYVDIYVENVRVGK